MAHPMIQIPDSSSLPACLLRLSDEQKVGINEAMANDENSSDDELRLYLVAELGVTDAQCDEALKFRGRFLTEPMFQLFDICREDLDKPAPQVRRQRSPGRH